MNKYLKYGLSIGCGGIVLLFIISFAIGMYARSVDGPMQSVMLLNTSNADKSVRFKCLDAQGELTGKFWIDDVIPPNGEKIINIPEGNYKIVVYNENDMFYKSTKYNCVLPVKDESNHHLHRFDLAMDKMFTVVFLNAVYGGNELAEHMSRAVGSNSNTLEFKEIYNGKTCFNIPEKYTLKTFIDLNNDIPSSVRYGEFVYGLFYTPDSLNVTDYKALIYKKVEEKLKD